VRNDRLNNLFAQCDLSTTRQIRCLVRPGGGVIGTVTWIIDHHVYGSVFRIEDLAVEVAYAGQGLGTWLLEQSIEAARRAHAYKVVLQAREDVAPFYTQQGFRTDQLNLRMDL
jgi:GNAT superfamily N-acetyltransferase